MKFSIIICTYNAAKRLPKTLDSIFAQTYDDYEVVIVDGASTDGTQNVILEYGKKFSDKLRWISERDTGLYNALNKGVKLARGKYLNIVGAGDWLEKDALSGASECIKKNPQADAVYGITKVWDKHCEENRLVQTSPDVLPIQPMQHPSMYYKKNLHDKFGQYDESYEIVADYVFCLKAFYFGRATACSFN
ncbi:MAG: glycosyl transferase family 2, partial [uncultured bacterium]